MTIKILLMSRITRLSDEELIFIKNNVQNEINRRLKQNEGDYNGLENN